MNKGHRASVSDTSSQNSKETVKDLVEDVWNVQFLHRIAGKKKENAAPLPRSLSHANVLLELLNMYPFNYDYP